eukprot:5154614-Pleurochrysis_carterae.AAC.1
MAQSSAVDTWPRDHTRRKHVYRFTAACVRLCVQWQVSEGNVVMEWALEDLQLARTNTLFVHGSIRVKHDNAFLELVRTHAHERTRSTFKASTSARDPPISTHAKVHMTHSSQGTSAHDTKLEACALVVETHSIKVTARTSRQLRVGLI